MSTCPDCEKAKTRQLFAEGKVGRDALLEGVHGGTTIPWAMRTRSRWAGRLAVVVMLTAREGVWGLVTRKFDLHLFPVRRHLRRVGAVAAPGEERTGGTT